MSLFSKGVIPFGFKVDMCYIFRLQILNFLLHCANMPLGFGTNIALDKYFDTLRTENEEPTPLASRAQQYFVQNKKFLYHRLLCHFYILKAEMSSVPPCLLMPDGSLELTDDT